MDKNDNSKKEDNGIIDFSSLSVDEDASTTFMEEETVDDKVQDESEDEVQDESEVQDELTGKKVEEEKSQEKVVENSDLSYKGLTKRLIESGKWAGIEGFSDIVENEEGEEVLTFNDDFEIDEETFLEIVENQDDLRKEETLKDKIDLKNLSEEAKTLVNIDMNGGDISEIRNKKKLVNPVLQLNPNKNDHAKSIVATRMKWEGKSDEEINRVINSLEKDLALKDQAKSDQKYIKEGWDLYLKEEEKKAEKQKQEQEENKTNFAKSLEDNIKEKFETNDSFPKTISKNYLSGGLDEKLEDIKADPEKAAELYFYITDPKEFLEQKFNNYKLENDLKTHKKIVLSKSINPNQIKSKDSRKSKTNKGVLDISQL